MFVRTIAAAALSVAVLASGSAFAGERGNFDALLTDTKAAAIGVTSAQAERSDRDLADSYIVMAESIANQGNEAKALDFLTFARGKLGLSRVGQPGAQAGTGVVSAPSIPSIQVVQADSHSSVH